MKDVIIKAGCIILNFIYFFMKLQPLRYKVVFLSRQSDIPPVDFDLIIDKMTQVYPEIKIVVLSKSLKPGLSGTVLYCFYMFRQMHHIASSRVAVTDTYCIPLSLLIQRRELTVIQIWHSIGLMKKAGYAAIGKEGGRDARTAKLMKMHKNYDIIFASSEACRESIAEIFDYSVDYIAVYPLPITDLLRDENYKNEITKRVLIDYPQLTDKKNIVYAPTFRHDETWLQEKLDELIQAVDYSSHNLIFKPHPLSNLVVTDNRVIVDKKYSSIEMIIVCDAVIVDYSSIIHEVAILGKPMYFYAFDYENFCGERGFFIDYLTEIPGNMYRSASSLFEDIVQDDYDFEKEAKFLETYIDLSSADCTLDIVNLIAEKLNTGRAHE